MRSLMTCILLPLISGCLTASVPEVAYWTVDYVGQKTKIEKPMFAVARISNVNVRAPYDVPMVSVLRADGTIAFDHYNKFAAAPAQLIKGMAVDSAVASGLFKEVVSAGSSASTGANIELSVTRMVLDCSQEEQRNACVEVQILIVKDRNIVASVKGAGVACAIDGRYGAAFSKALSSAISAAFSEIQ